MPWRSHIKLADGRNLRDISGTIGFESDAQEPYKGFAKGSLSFWEGMGEPTSYLATIRLSPDELARLLQTIQAGLPLESVNIDVEALEHGWGEGEATWDVVEHQAAEVQGYTLWFGQPERDADEVDPDVNSLVAIRELHRKTRYLTKIPGWSTTGQLANFAAFGRQRVYSRGGANARHERTLKLAS